MQISLFSEIRSSNHASDQENLPWLRGTTAFWGFRQVYELKYQYIGTVYLQEVRETQLQVGDSSSGWSKVLWIAACVSVVVPVITFVGLLIYRALNDFEKLPHFSVKQVRQNKKEGLPELSTLTDTLSQVLNQQSEMPHKKQFIVGLLIKEIARQDIKMAVDLVNEHIVRLPLKKRLIMSMAKDLLETDVDGAFALYRQLHLERSDLAFSIPFFEHALKNKCAKVTALLELEKLKGMWHTNESFAKMMIDLLITENRQEDAEVLALELFKFYESSVIKGLRFKSTLFLSSIISLNSVKVIETAIKFFSTYHQVSRAVLLALNDLQKSFDAIESLEPKSKIIAFILIAKALSMRSEKTVDAENAQQRAIQELKSFLLNKNAISVADRDLIEFLLNADGDLTLMKQAYANNFDFSIQRGVLSVASELMKDKNKEGFKDWFLDCYSNLSDSDRDMGLSLVYESLTMEGKIKGLKDLISLQLKSDMSNMLYTDQALFSEAWKLCPQEFAEYLVEESKKKEKMDSLYEYTTYDY